MRKCSLLILFFLFVAVPVFAQQAPMGMKYQAVARDLKGNVLGEKELSLRISLAGNQNQSWTHFYSETHAVQTTQLGLFTIVVGEGTPVSGKFAEIPWTSEDIWMEVSIREGGSFVTLSNSRLLAVPFAFHAFTAGQLAGADGRSPGIPSNVWSLFGNSNTNPENDALGTTDNADLVIITNNLERMRLKADGNVEIKRSLNIGANLKVDSNVVLNDKQGSTINRGPFTVDRNSPTLLSGTLTVDLATDLNADLNVDGPADFQSRLTVNNASPTKLTGSLLVEGVTTLKDSFYVAASKPSVFTGPVRADSNATFKQSIILDNPNLNSDTSSLVPAGALQVAGGGGFGGNLTVAGSARIGGGLTLGSLKVTDTISSFNTSTGALTVAGGVGIAKQLNVGGKTVIENSLDVNAGNGQVRITGGVDGDDQNSLAYPLVVTGKKQGIEVKLTATNEPTGDNNFMTFRDNGNVVRGRIEGQTRDELNADPWYRWDVANYTLYVVFAGVDVALAVAELVATIADWRICAGLGVCLVSPSISNIVVKALVLAAKIVQLGQQTVNLASFLNNKYSNLGVSYSSSAGDYAEWLPKENTGLRFQPGQIVGVRKGQISLNTTGAERVLVISTNPIVLGNNPEAGKESLYEKVAFLGQVPVRVSGPVSAGDYIVASDRHDGTGTAVHPDKLSIDDIPRIVGVAWSNSNIADVKPVKVAVGLTANDLTKIVKQLEQKMKSYVAEMNAMRQQFNETNEQLAKLVPGFNPGKMPVEKEKVTPEVVRPSAPSPAPALSLEQAVSAVNSYTGELSVLKKKADPARMQQLRNEIISVVGAKIKNPEEDRFPEMTDQMIDKFLEWGTVYAEESGAGGTGIDNASVLLKTVNSDPHFRQFLYNKIRQTYNQRVEEIKMRSKGLD